MTTIPTTAPSSPPTFTKASALTPEQLQAQEQAAALHRQQVAAAVASDATFVPATTATALPSPKIAHMHDEAAEADSGPFKRRRVYGMTPQTSGGAEVPQPADTTGSGTAAPSSAATAAPAAATVTHTNEPSNVSGFRALTASELHAGSKRKEHAQSEAEARSSEESAEQAAAKVNDELEMMADSELSKVESPSSDSGSGDLLEDVCDGQLADPDTAAEAEEENALEAEAQYEQEADSLQCRVSGRVGYGLAQFEMDKMLQEMKERKTQQLARRKQTQLEMGEEMKGTEEAAAEPPLLTIKKKPVPMSSSSAAAGVASGAGAHVQK